MSADVRQIVNAQAKRRSVAFLAGLIALVVVGSLWAGLRREPLNPFGNAFDEPAIVVNDFAPPPPRFAPVPAPAPFPPPEEFNGDN